MRMQNYEIDFSGALVWHQLHRVIMVRDEDRVMGYEKPAPTTATDYFGHLATWIDEVSLSLGRNNLKEIAKLQRVVDDLLFLYEHYEIKKKPPLQTRKQLKSRKS